VSCEGAGSGGASHAGVPGCTIVRVAAPTAGTLTVQLLPGAGVCCAPAGGAALSAAPWQCRCCTCSTCFLTWRWSPRPGCPTLTVTSFRKVTVTRNSCSSQADRVSVGSRQAGDSRRRHRGAVLPAAAVRGVGRPRTPGCWGS
jgi:hypothetical protein